MRVEQEASGPDHVQRISRPELNRLARRLLLAAREAGRHLDAGRGALTEPVRDVAEAFRELTELIKGGPRAGSPGADATADSGRRVPPPRVGEGAWLSRTLHDDARRMARAAEAMATSLLSKEFTDKTLFDSVGEALPETPDDEEPLGERMVSAGFDVASYALLEPSDGEAVSRQAVTEATRHSGAGTKAAWSMVQYALGASPLEGGERRHQGHRCGSPRLQRQEAHGRSGPAGGLVPPGPRALPGRAGPLGAERVGPSRLFA
ncbi:hypothetical protein [Streptomyces mirabilis]|uniref:hypothetical protein n=1 Tax=Streptomyces mirabilis TaxID=68239 RepID=UPI0036B57783